MGVSGGRMPATHTHNWTSLLKSFQAWVREMGNCDFIEIRRC